MNEAPQRPLFSAIRFVIVLALVAASMNLIYQSFIRPLEPDAVAGQVKQLIAYQWHSHDAMKLARVEAVTLERKDGNEYAGLVVFSLGGYRTDAPITVKAARGSDIEWKLDGPSDQPLRMVNVEWHQIFVQHPVTMAEAKAYADWAADEKRLGRDPGSTVLSRTQGVTIVRIGMQAHVLADMEADPEFDSKTTAFFRDIAEGLSVRVFRGPVDINLCDTKLATKKVIAWR
jgi:hypothetical protein